jgi:hypothetical protein
VWSWSDQGPERVHSMGYHENDFRPDCGMCAEEVNLVEQSERINANHPEAAFRFGPMTPERLMRSAGKKGMTAVEFADHLEANLFDQKK